MEEQSVFDLIYLKYFAVVIVYRNMMSGTFLFGLVLLAVSLILFTIALGGISYQHIVELPRWKRSVGSPDFGKFFKLFMPASFISLFLATLLLWTVAGAAAWWLAAAVVGVILTTVFTSRYFVPIHQQLFDSQTSVAQREILTDRWRVGNRYRIALMAMTSICNLLAYSLLLIADF